MNFSTDGRQVQQLFPNKYTACQKKIPTIPFIIVGTDAQLKHYHLSLQSVERMGHKIIDRKRVNKLAREIGAVKYLECSSVSWRGYKILFDEIASAYFSKLKDEEEKRKEAEEDKISQRKVGWKNNVKIKSIAIFRFSLSYLVPC